MKTIHIYLEDEEYNILIQRKKDLSWHDFVMLLAGMTAKKGDE